MVLANDKMKAGRYLRWHVARKSLAWIKARSAEGLDVYVSKYTKCTRFTPKTMAKGEWFKATRSGLYVARWCGTCGRPTPAPGDCSACAQWWKDNAP